MRMSEKRLNNNNSDNSLISRPTDGGKNTPTYFADFIERDDEFKRVADDEDDDDDDKHEGDGFVPLGPVVYVDDAP